MNAANIDDLIVTITDINMGQAYDDSPMVNVTFTVSNTTHRFTVVYECGEYVDEDGTVNDTTESHMNVNGIYNRTYRFRQAIVDRGMEPDERATWTKVEEFLREQMQDFVESNLKQAA